MSVTASYWFWQNQSPSTRGRRQFGRDLASFANCSRTRWKGDTLGGERAGGGESDKDRKQKQKGPSGPWHIAIIASQEAIAKIFIWSHHGMSVREQNSGQRSSWGEIEVSVSLSLTAGGRWQVAGGRWQGEGDREQGAESRREQKVGSSREPQRENDRC